MGIWDFDAFASDDAYDVLGKLDDLLAAHSTGVGGAGLRTALRTVRLPCMGYDYDAETGAPTPTTERPVSLSAARVALAWLADLVTTAIHQPMTDETERKAVAALGAIAAIRVVIMGTETNTCTPAQREEWALWLETGPNIWTTDLRRAAARRALAYALRRGEMVAHTPLVERRQTILPHTP